MNLRIRQLAKQAAAHGAHAKGTGQNFADGGAVDDAGNEDRFQASRARDKAAQAVAAPYNKGSAGVKASEPPVVKNPPWAQSASNFALGGVVPPPTMGVSSAYPPPQGHRSEGPRNYGKK